MSTVISAASILIYTDRRKILSWHSTPGPKGENLELREKLFHYFSQLNVTSYNEYRDGTIKWFLNGEAYSQDQIDRMMKLKLFT